MTGTDPNSAESRASAEKKCRTGGIGYGKKEIAEGDEEWPETVPVERE
jgi:hypothetical protein